MIVGTLMNAALEPAHGLVDITLRCPRPKHPGHRRSPGISGGSSQLLCSFLLATGERQDFSARLPQSCGPELFRAAERLFGIVEFAKRGFCFREVDVEERVLRIHLKAALGDAFRSDE